MLDHDSIDIPTKHGHYSCIVVPGSWFAKIDYTAVDTWNSALLHLLVLTWEDPLEACKGLFQPCLTVGLAPVHTRLEKLL